MTIEYLCPDPVQDGSPTQHSPMAAQVVCVNATLSLKGLHPMLQERGDNMATTETIAILDAARELFGLTDAKLEKFLTNPEQMLAIADILEASQ